MIQKKHLGILTIAVVVAIGLFLGMADPALAKKDKDTFYIGCIINLTGWMNAYCTGAYEGVKMAVKAINDKGGVDGKWKIKVAAKDTRSELAPAIPAAREFLADGVDVILGGGSSEQTVAIGRLAAPKGIMTITMTQSNPTVPHDIPKGMGFTFTTCDNLQGAAMAQYAIEQGFKSVYLLRSPDDAYFDMLPVYFGEAFEKLGGKVVGTGEFSLGQTEFSVEVAKIKAHHPQPELIFSAICCGELGAFIKRLRSDGVTIPFWGSDVIDDTSILGLGSIIEGVVFNSAGAVSPENPAMEEFARLYEKEYGRQLQVAFPALGWEVVKLLEQAVLKGGSIESTKIRNAFASFKNEKLPIGTGSTITYAGTDGNPVRAVAICEARGGKKSFVKWITPKSEDVPKPR